MEAVAEAERVKTKWLEVKAEVEAEAEEEVVKNILEAEAQATEINHFHYTRTWGKVFSS